MTHAVTIESWPIAGDGFTISRETKRDAYVVCVTLNQNGATGMGECVPLKRYGHTPEKIKAEIEAWLAEGHRLTRAVLQETLRAGPARFALDTALWQLKAEATGQELWQSAGLRQNPLPLPTAFTLSGAAPEVMAEMAETRLDHRWLKIKLMGDGMDIARIRAIHAAAPKTELIVDANEALTLDSLQELLPVLESHNVVLIEQPLPEGKDEVLRDFTSAIPLAADESCHTSADLEKLRGKYDVVNLKLDKTGGLSHALEMARQAKEMGFQIMVGCMVSTGLSIYPACLVAADADFVDLDGALLLVNDRPDSRIAYRDGRVICLD